MTPIRRVYTIQKINLKEFQVKFSQIDTHNQTTRHLSKLHNLASSQQTLVHTGDCELFFGYFLKQPIICDEFFLFQ